MKNFYTALYSLFNPVASHLLAEDGSNLLTEEGSQLITEEDTASNSFNTSIGGRLFNTYAPENTEYPYAVFTHIEAHPSYTFTEEETYILLQFSIFSTNPSSVEVHDCMGYLKALLDNCYFTITGHTLLRFDRGSEGLTSDEFETHEGLQRCWHYHVDYSIILNKV